MTERCAVCGGENVWKRVSLPTAWADYLAEERDLSPAEGYYLLPACDECADRVSMQKELDDVMGEVDEDTLAMLDELDKEELVEEAVDGGR